MATPRRADSPGRPSVGDVDTDEDPFGDLDGAGRVYAFDTTTAS